MFEQFTTLDKLHYEVDSSVRREDLFHGYDEGVLDLKEDELFNFETLDRFVLEHNIFPYTLHGEI
jgi:hypothetical protein